MTCFNRYLKDRVTNEANYNLILAVNYKVGALSVTVHEVVHVACQTLTILSFRIVIISDKLEVDGALLLPPSLH